MASYKGRGFTRGPLAADNAAEQSDCFSPVRKLMTCCAADLYSVGFKCRFTKAQALTANEWVKVTVTLAFVDTGGGTQELRI